MRPLGPLGVGLLLGATTGAAATFYLLAEGAALLYVVQQLLRYCVTSNIF